MGEWRKICCAVDLSERSHLAIETAAALARRMEAELFLVHVRTEHGAGGKVPFAPPPAPSTTKHAPPLQHWAHEAQRLSGGVVTSIELGGAAAAALADFAREFACDLIVVGERRRGALRWMRRGSTTEEVVRSAPCAVLVARGALAG